MREKNEYNTRSRKLIFEYLSKNCETTVSVEDILNFLKEQGISVSFTTVYRYLNKLSNEKKVIKIIDDTTKRAVYQLSKQHISCDEHLHIKCVNCGKLIHLDCGFIDELKTHILQDHGFELRCSGSILYGKCHDCSKLEG